MIDVEQLPLKHWAKTVLIDSDIIDEIADLKYIKMAYPKRVIRFDEWEIKKVTVSSTRNHHQVVDFYTETIYKGQVYTQRFRVYSPHFPRVKRLSQYIGGKIVGANLMCTAELNGTQIHVARYIQTIKTDNLKSNPITQLDPKSVNLTYHNCILEANDYKNYKPFKKQLFKDLYFHDRKDNDIFV